MRDRRTHLLDCDRGADSTHEHLAGECCSSACWCVSPLSYLAERLVVVNRENGWNRYNRSEAWDEEFTIPTALALIHSEVSEALEDFREGDREHFGEELADVAIRLFDLAYGVGVDLDEEIERKTDKNRKRGYRHGGKKV